jgi:tetratricopeptide (TPR) repeat protein
MPRLLLILSLLIVSASAASDIPGPASLPESVPHGDSPATHPAEAARRLLAGKALLEQGEVEPAMAEFNRALAADDGQPLVYFYQAVAAYRLGDYPRALQRAENGAGVVADIYAYGTPTAETDALAARFKELKDAIQKKLAETGGKAGENPEAKKREFAAAMKEGDEAYGKGLAAKAATAYTRAYRADPTQGEIGLRAASLHADRLKDLFEAALLWQQVLAGGEPHATAARAELQARRDALDSLLREGLGRREQWRRSGDPAEALRFAAAFPESTELQVELAILFARQGRVDEMIAHLEAASRLGLSADDFLAQKEFVDYLEKSGGINSAGGLRLSGFVRDAYGASTLATIGTELKRRADEVARAAREKAAQERQAILAAERQKLGGRRDARRKVLVNEASQIFSRRNNVEVETAGATPSKYNQGRRHLMYRATQFSFDGQAYVLSTDLLNRSVRKNGATTDSGNTYTYMISSFASFRAAATQPSNWIDYDVNSPFQVLGPNRALCKRLEINFTAGVVLEQAVYRDANGDVSRNPELRDYSQVSVGVMLDDAEVARLQELFAELARLDAAGNNIEKLRALQL